jgi:diguanylate cyclase (GGDEF)-like protein
MKFITTSYFTFFKTHSTKLLVIGYILLIILFSLLLLMDSAIQKGQINAIKSSDIATLKMKTIVGLIEVARKRVSLSHEMISTDDIFEKDDISQKISELGTEFILNYSQLLKQDLTPFEKDILNSINPKFEIIRQNLRNVTELAIENTAAHDEEGRKIILYRIVPMQQIIVNGFMQILSQIQQIMHSVSEEALIDYSKNKQYRYILISIMFLASMFILVWVIKRLSSIEQKLHSLSLTDGLTGIANRRNFDNHLAMVWMLCYREKVSTSLLLIDIDYFKKYNDFYGHQKGDECLIQIASVIKSMAQRTNDLAARYGGEEFSIILPKTEQDSAIKIAESLIEAVNKEKIPHETSNVSSHVTISIGVASVIPSKKTSYLELIKMADEGLYFSKEKGRNQVNFYNGL